MLTAGVWICTLSYAVIYKGLMVWSHLPSAFWSGVVGQAQSAGTGFANPQPAKPAPPKPTTPRGAKAQ